ncbi:hypothetical protein HZC09_01820, partial [Candidatus Micrarchaeota archaeon]|nr:hypothetical protein [Candidatus Micrarchaeota archaeon]
KETVSGTAEKLGWKFETTREQLAALSEKIRKPLHDAVNAYDSSRHGPFSDVFLNEKFIPQLKGALLKLKNESEQDAAGYSDDDRELALRANKSQDAFVELTGRMQPLLSSLISKRRWPRTFSRADRQQEATAGLILAVKDFDPSRGRFRAFAETVVDRYLVDALTRPRTRKRNKS